MKLNNIKSKNQTTEGFRDALTSIRKSITGPRDSKERFIDNFIKRLYSTLDSEIQSGRVDPNAASAAPTAQPAPPPTAPGAPAASSTTAKTAPGNAAAPGATQKQTSQNINNYVRGLAQSLNKEPDRVKKMALAKELVNFMADRKNYPEWQNAVATAQQVIKRGIADTNFANSAVNRLKTGQMMESWKVYWINKLLESVGFTFKDLGLILLKENKKNGQYILAESKYYKLNTILESVITEAETISQFLQRWVPAYTRVKMNDATSLGLMKKVQDTYAVDKGKAALTQLANAAYAASFAPGYGASDATPAVSAPATSTPATSTPASVTSAPATPEKLVTNIKASLSALKKTDPAMYASLVKSISDGSSASPTTPTA